MHLKSRDGELENAESGGREKKTKETNRENEEKKLNQLLDIKTSGQTFFMITMTHVRKIQTGSTALVVACGHFSGHQPFICLEFC